MKKTLGYILYLKSLIFNLNVRLNLSLIFGLLVNTAYILGNLMSALLYHSLWSATLTVYHLILVIIRLYILTSPRAAVSQQKTRSICLRVGVFMLFFGLASALLMIYSIKRGIFVRYSGLILLGFLIYTIYSVTKSIVYMRRHASDNRPIHYAARNISLSTSLMSVFNLQYSLLSFLGADYRLISGAIFLCGALVFAIILSLSLRLILTNRDDTLM